MVNTIEVSLIVVGSVDSSTISTDFLAVNQDIGLQTWVTVGVWVLSIVSRLGVRDRITICHWEGINEVLSWVDTAVTIQRWRILILLKRMALTDVTTEADLQRILIRELVRLDHTCIVIPVPTIRIHTSQTTYILQRISSILSCLLPCHSTCRCISRRSSKDSNLSLEGSNITTVDLTLLQVTESLIVLFVLTTNLSVLCRNTRSIYITILCWEILQSLVKVGHNLIDTLLESITWLIEIRRTILWLQMDRKTHNLAIHLTSVSTQQVEEVQTTESQCITLIKISVHHVQRLCRVVPLNIVTS